MELKKYLKKRKSLIFYFLSLIVVITLISCWESQEKQVKSETKPNIILVITDDQGYGDLGITGNPIIKTPAIDEFANESVALTNYRVGTTCAPTRAGF